MVRKLPLLFVLVLTPAARAQAIPPLLELSPPHVIPAGHEFLITDYGAVGDGKTIDTDAIQKTIDAAAQAAGTVVIPKGVFVSGSLFIRKAANLRIDQGGILKGSTAVKDYSIIDSRFEGIERPVMAALVNVFNVNGITVSGSGTIDGSGDIWLANFPRRRRVQASGSSTNPASPTSRPTTPVEVEQGPRTVLTPTPGHALPPLPGSTLMKPRLFNFTNCTNIVMKDLHLQNPAIWCLHILYCTDILVDNLQIHEPLHRIPSSDGIDIDSCSRVHVDHTTIEANDDCISIKSGKDADGHRVNRPSQDILVTNTHFAYGQGGVAIGSEVSGGVHHVEVRDCVCDSGNWAPVRLKSQPARGGRVDDIVYRNFKIDNVREAFVLTLAWNMREKATPTLDPTRMKDIYLINVSGTAHRAGAINGIAGSPITDVHFINCNVIADSPLRIQHAERIDTAGLHLHGPSGASLQSTSAPATITQPDGLVAP